jgi:hypothetical protein
MESKARLWIIGLTRFLERDLVSTSLENAMAPPI